MSYYNDDEYDFVQYLDTEQLEDITKVIGLPPRYSHLDPNKTKKLAEEELRRRRDKKKEEQTDLLVGLADTRSKHLLSILEKIAKAIEKKPKQTIVIIIFVPVAIAVLINLINFIGKELWINLLIPLFKQWGLSVQ